MNGVIAVPKKVWEIMQPRIVEAENYSVSWTNQDALQANVVKNKSTGTTTGAVVDLKALKTRDYACACDRRCLLFSRGLCVHICAALKVVPTTLGGPWNWEQLLPYLDTMEAWDE